MRTSPVVRWLLFAVAPLSVLSACGESAPIATPVSAQFREVLAGPTPDVTEATEPPKSDGKDVTKDEVVAALGDDLVEAAGLFVDKAQDLVAAGQSLTPDMYTQLGRTEAFTAFAELAPEAVAALPTDWPYYLPDIGCAQIDAVPRGEATAETPITACGGDEKPRDKYLLAEAKLGSRDVESAEASPSKTGGGYLVTITFTKAGAKKWKDLTEATIDKNVAIVTDGEVISAPTILGAIPNGVAEITGTFTLAEAEKLAAGIEAGAKPLD